MGKNSAGTVQEDKATEAARWRDVEQVVHAAKMALLDHDLKRIDQCLKVIEQKAQEGLK